MIQAFLQQARPELEKLNAALAKALAEGRMKDAKASADRIAEIASWGAQVEDIEARLSAKPVAPSASNPTPAIKPPVAKVVPARIAKAEPVSAPLAVEAPPSAEPEVPVAELAPRTPGRPRLLPPEPSEEDKLKARRKNLEARLKEFLDFAREIMGEDRLNPTLEARAKSIIALGRALEEEALALKAASRSIIREEILMLGDWWDKAASNPEYFGLNQNRSHSPEVWFEIAEAYGILSDVESAVSWLETSPGISEIQKNALMEMAACGEAYLLRVFDDRGLPVWDSQQKDLHARLEKMEPPSFVTRWWKRTDPPPAEELRKRGGQLAEEVNNLRRAKERAEATTNAMADLKDYMAEAVSSNFDEDVLRAKITAAMDAGVPPSHRELRNLLAGYRFVLEGVNHRDVQKLDQYLQKDALEVIAKKKAPVELTLEEEDPDLAMKVLALLPHTTGKTLMFVGGSKGQGWRKDEYIRILGLKDMIWPDAEEGTKVTDLSGKVSKADIVCLLIRFSRHSYKSVLDEAKSQGKETVTLPRGYGVNTVIHEMWTQLLGAPQAEPAPV